VQETNPHLRTAILEVVDNQLKANDPPETKQTYERLQREGYSKAEAKRLIACVVVAHIYDILKHRRRFDQAAFVAELNALPKPWEEAAD
jgi:hypothetical protein